MVPTTLGDAALRALLLQTYLEVHKAEQERGVVPRGDHTVIGRHRRVFEFVGAIVLGLLVASSSVLVVFVITRVILHLDFSRYVSA